MQMSKEPMRTIPVPMTFRMIAEVEELAKKKEVSRSQIIREFTKQGLEKTDPQTKEKA